MIHVPPGGLYFEDVEPGSGFETDERAITAADIDAFAELTGDHHGVIVGGMSAFFVEKGSIDGWMTMTRAGGSQCGT